MTTDGAKRAAERIRGSYADVETIATIIDEEFARDRATGNAVLVPAERLAELGAIRKELYRALMDWRHAYNFEDWSGNELPVPYYVDQAIRNAEKGGVG